MRVVLYARVSTEDQAKNYSIPSQLEAMRKFASEHDLEVIHEFVDEGISGAILDRPQLGELREWVRQKIVDAVIVYDPDRLSRKLAHLMVLADEFDRLGAQLNFVTQAMSQSPEDRMLFGMKGVFAEYERTKILERTTRGKLRKARDGKQPGGKSLYGYRLVNGSHEVYEDQAKIIRMIFDWLVKDGLTLYACQMRLNKSGIPSPKGKTWWARAAVYRIAANEAYAGVWHYNRRSEKGGRDTMRAKEEWIPIPIPAIISRDVFELVQRRFEKNRAFAMRNTKREYLLSGLLVCSKCGRSYTGWTSRGTAYYRCRSKRGDISPVPCPSCCVRGDRIEPIVWDTISRLLAQPQLIIDHVKKDGHKPLKYLEPNLDRVRQALARKNTEADRMLEAYKIAAIDLPTLKKKMDDIRSEEAQLNKERLRLEVELRQAQAQELNEEKLYEFCQSLPAVLTSLDFESKRQILMEVVDKIVVDSSEITVYGIIPPTPRDIAEDASIVLHSPC